MAYYGGWARWARYVPVADRIRNGARHAAKLAKQGRAPRPVIPSGRGRALATTFWGRAWCDNLAAYAVLSNRLERGRSYLRNGLVIDLQISPGTVAALVSGSAIYEIRVRIKPPEDGAVPGAGGDRLRVHVPGRLRGRMAVQARRGDPVRSRRAARRGSGAAVSPAPGGPRRLAGPRHRRPRRRDLAEAQRSPCARGRPALGGLRDRPRGWLARRGRTEIAARTASVRGVGVPWTAVGVRSASAVTS